MNTDDRQYMLRAIELAANGLGRVSPNPPVGCVIVNGGKIVGEGWHQQYGGAHAEPNAINSAGENCQGATAYVTLMPCNHYGKTPPCTQALINAGIKRVVVAVDDPNEESGNGMQTMTDAGLTVETGLLAEEAEWVMHGFIKHIKTGLAHLHLKYAMTLDGKIATSSGDSKWISSESSRSHVQNLRRKSDAVMVGSGTARADDPSLNVREGDTSVQPFRVIVDSALTTVPEAKIFSTNGAKVIILCAESAETAKQEALINAGADILTISTDGAHLNLKEAISKLAEVYGIRNILCEGGAGLAGALMNAGLVDEISAFVCPKILGGSGISPFEGHSPQLMSDAVKMLHVTYRQFGDDLLINGRIIQ